MQNLNSNYEVSAREVLRVLFKRKFVFFWTFCLSMLSVFLYINMLTPLYESSSKILVSSMRKPLLPYYTELEVTRRSQPSVTQGEIVKGSCILREVVKSLNLDKRDDEYKFYPRIKKIVQPIIDSLIDSFSRVYRFVKEKLLGSTVSKELGGKIEQTIRRLKRNITVEQVEDSDIFYIKVRDYDPVMAQKIANEINRQYIIFDLREELANLRVKYGEKHPRILRVKDVLCRIEKADFQKAVKYFTSLGMGTIKVIEPASTPLHTCFPRARLLYLLTAAFSLLASCSLIFVMDAMDTTFKNPWEFEQISNIPVLASVPKYSRLKQKSPLIRNVKSNAPYTHSYKKIADQIYLAVKGQGNKIILLSDMCDSFNSGINIINIGIIFSKLYKQKVLLLESDFREAPLRKIMGSGSSEGFSDILVNKASIEECIQKGETGMDTIFEGKTDYNPLIMLSSNKTQDTFNRLREKYEIVLVNCSQVSQYRDLFILSDKSDGIIITLKEGTVHKEAIKPAIAALKEINMKIIGSIFNNRTYPIPYFLYNRL
ncbi:MAG: hypothetical protein B6D56_01435 [Candidatus Omnitrophica bacterium 4484_70.1]|nr:MAG: hypothetical protein B6D56_01435 [Candidatus Omnitrophica bacterium 4484_70.1]